MNKGPVIIVDDEKSALLSVEMTLKSNNIENIVTFNSSEDAWGWLENNEPAAALLDITMPGKSGIEIMELIVERYPACGIIMITGINDVETAVNCIKKGSYDYLVKPIERERLMVAANNLLKRIETEKETEAIVSSMNKPLKNRDNFSEIITSDHGMMNIFRYIEAVAPGEHSVLITGETGTGKELIAKAIHKASGRKGEFVAVNAAGLDDNLFSDTLFGHVKGAFTGADSERQGLIEKAEKGTLFLDEIGDLESASQIKLLRLLQENEYSKLGSDKTQRCDIRIVAATNKNIEELKSSEAFRQDLFYRLKTHLVELAPLRERKNDIPLLSRFFAGGKEVSDSALSALLSYDFPGNIRELQAVIMDASARSEIITTEVLGINPETPGNSNSPGILFGEPLPTLEQADEALMSEALKRTGGNQSAAASILGISRQAMHKRLNRQK